MVKSFFYQISLLFHESLSCSTGERKDCFAVLLRVLAGAKRTVLLELVDQLEEQKVNSQYCV